MAIPHSIRCCVSTITGLCGRPGLIISRQPDMKRVGTASSGEEAVEAFGRCRPDITLMDQPARHERPRRDQGDQASGIARPHRRPSRCIRGEEYIFTALEAGAASYLLEGHAVRSPRGCDREVYEGRRALPPDVEARLAARGASNAHLTPREVQVVSLIAQGMRSKGRLLPPRASASRPRRCT